ncbi:uncharacterized protein LOC143037061 [Oratosquilla oratoria]|uniref:uncharacterized protein LOC143037061 n=1 Tax=Oratosquilla oratoria TaxID=337810 RepID=UPI003F7729D7
MGPLPIFEGHRYLFMAIDLSMHLPKAIATASASASSCAAAIVSGWITKFGLPDHITLDLGTAFTLQLWTSLGQLLDTTIHYTTAYNPEAKGLVERLHRTLKAALMSRCTEASWCSQLPWVLLGLGTSSKDALDALLAEMVYDDPLVIPGKIFPDTIPNEDLNRLRCIVGKFAPCRQTFKPANRRYVPKDHYSSKYSTSSSETTPHHRRSLRPTQVPLK